MNSEVITDDRQQSATHVEVDIRQLAQKEVATDRRPDAEPSGNDIATKANVFVDRVSANAAIEIANLISELQNLRDYLHNEGQRVQREISGYVHVNEGAMKATKMIVEALPRWRIKSEGVRNNPR